MKKLITDFFSAVIAGICIGIGGIVFLSIEDKVIGSVLFSVGLLTILVFKLNLFTGKAPYICMRDLKYSGFVGVVWLGNFAGTFIISFLVRYTTIYNKIAEKCTAIAEVKTSMPIVSLFILGCLCGILMFIAVDTYNKDSYNRNFSATLIVVLCVSVFILSGFEHSVADMFYFMLTLPVKQWILPLIVITFGNVAGGNFFCYTVNALKEA